MARGASTFNHRTLAIMIIAIGAVGALLELVGPLSFPRLGLFFAMLASGSYYLGRVLRRG